MSEQPRPTRTLMYLGTKVVYVKGNFPKATDSQWLDLSGIENDGRPLATTMNGAEQQKRKCLYPTKVARCRGEPGSIWVFDIEEAGSTTIFPGTGRAIGVWRNEEDVLSWQAKETTLRRELVIAGKAAQEIGKKLPMETLKPFRRAYWSLNTRQRGILLAWIMGYITGGSLDGND